MTDQKDILEKNDKGISESRGILTHLFREILFMMKINSFRWDKMMRAYLHNPANRIPQNSKDKSSARGNLNKELRRERMTWKVFVKALKFLGPVKIRFEVHLYWPGRATPTIHHVEIDQQTLDTEESLSDHNEK